MVKKEKIKIFLAAFLSVIAFFSSVTAIKLGISVIFAESSAGEDMISGGAMFAYAFVYLTELLVSVFAASASILGSFFSFFVRKHEKKAIKYTFSVLFCSNAVLAFFDILTAVVMCF